MTQLNVEGIPAELRSMPRWVCHREKEPYTPAGWSAKSNDEKTWSTFYACLRAYQNGGFDGVGIVFGLVDDNGYHLCGLDIDHCKIGGAFLPEALALVDDLYSYTEVSPSGEGLHVLLYSCHPWPDGCRTTIKTSVGPVKIEMYHSGRYFTVTGDHLHGTPDHPAGRTDAADDLHSRLFPPKSKTTVQPSPICEARREDDDVIRIAGRAKNSDKVIKLYKGDISGYPSASEADAALCAILAHYTRDAAQIDRIFRRSELYRVEKWDAKRGAKTYGQITIEHALSLLGGAA